MRRKTKWIGHILRRNSQPKHIIESKVEVRGRRGRRGRRRKQLMDDLRGKKMLGIERGMGP